MRPLFWRGMVVGTECKKWIGSNQLSESKINEINSEYMGSSILFNLNRSGAGLETFLWSAWICMFEFLFCFSSGSVLFWILKRDILLVWLFALLHVFWKTKKKKFLSILPWIVEYIVLYHHSPWGHSSVGLYKKTKSSSSHVLPLCKNVQGWIFIWRTLSLTRL